MTPLLRSTLTYINLGDPGAFQQFAMAASSEPGLLCVETEVPVTPIEIAAMCTASYRLDYSVALSILNYGRNVKVQIAPFVFLRFFYNTINPGKRYLRYLDPTLEDPTKDNPIHWKCWHGYRFWLIAHMEFCARKNPSLFHKMCWMAKLVRISFSSSNENELLGILMCGVVDFKTSWICSGVVFFYMKMRGIK